MLIKKSVIIMGYSCNNNCIFCCNSKRREETKDEQTPKIKRKILEAKKEGATYLELIGGEPTIRKDIFEIVKFAKKLDFDTIMFATNGRMFSNKEFVKKILDAGINHIVFSIHGHNSRLHDALTMVPGSFKQLKKGVENLKEIGFKNIGSNTTIVKQNYKNLIDIGEFIYNLGIRNSEFIFVDPTHGAPKENFDDIVPTYEEVSPYLNSLLEFGKKMGVFHWHVRYYPLCFLEERYHGMISELEEKETFKTEHLAPDFVNRDVERSRREIGRTKIKGCQECVYFNKCEGPWKEYVRVLGDEEFKPIKIIK